MRERIKGESLPRFSTIALPTERYIPGQSTRPTDSPVDSLSTAITMGLPTNEAFCYGVDLFNYGFYWEAHEAWEHLWIPRKESAEGVLLKGLIQITAAMVKRAQGNAQGESLLRTSAMKYLKESDLCATLFENDLFSESLFKGEPKLNLNSGVELDEEL